MNPTSRRSRIGRRSRVASFGVLTAVLLGACGTTDRPVVLAASSLTDIAPAIAAAADLDLDFVFAGSPTLITQLANGIDAAVIITADNTQMTRAAASGRTGPPTTLARNTLVVAVAPGNPGRLQTLNDLGDPRHLIGRCAPAVPCGVLTDQLASAANITISATTEEPGVRSLATKIGLGELDAGLIYRTDADNLGLTTIADSQLQQLGGFTTDYQAAVIDQSPAGQQLIDAFASPRGQQLLRDAGFSP